MEKARVRNLARVLPDPIVDALEDEGDLHSLMKPTFRDAICLPFDVRGSTQLLKEVGPFEYLETVCPMMFELHQQARRLHGFAKFEGDGLLVVFGAFDDRPVDREMLEMVIGFLRLVHELAVDVNDKLSKRR